MGNNIDESLNVESNLKFHSDWAHMRGKIRFWTNNTRHKSIENKTNKTV